MSDIERAARAIRDKFVLKSEAQWCARAVISAVLSEPSEAMVEATLEGFAYSSHWRDAPVISVGRLRARLRAALIAAGKQIVGDDNG